MFKQIPPFTRSLLLINVICYLLQLLFERSGIDLVALFGLHFAKASDFYLFQLLTYMFLHGSFSHLFFNMFSLWMFGGIIERSLGSRRFLTYYLICGIGAGLCQELWQLGEYYMEGMNGYEFVGDGIGAPIPMDLFLNRWTTIGASGACYGVLLAFGMLYPNERIVLHIPPIPIKAKYFVAGYAAIELYSAYASNDNIAHFAHLGGMLFGFFLIRHWRSTARRQSTFDGWNSYQGTAHRDDSATILGRIRKWMHLDREGNHNANTTKNGNFRTTSTHQSDWDYNARRKQEEAEIDAILEKIRRSGYASLTAEEKKKLFEASKK